MRSKDHLYYIDKTKSLEEGIDRFPFVYMEGNAAVGKSAAVKVLLEKYPQVHSTVWNLSDPSVNITKEISKVCEQIGEQKTWIILENMPEQLDSEAVREIEKLSYMLKDEDCVIFISRYKPQKELLKLLWKGQMGMVPMEKLLFSQEDVRNFFKEEKVSLNAKEVYEKTGGWAGCVAVLARLSKIYTQKSVNELLGSYEIRNYIKGEILSNLTLKEQKLLSQISACPWVNEKFLEEVWQIENAEEYLENLWRKGFLLCEYGKKCWKLAPLLKDYIEESLLVTGREYVWYENYHHIAEMFACLEKNGEQELYQEYLSKYYRAVYSQGVISEKLAKRTKNTPKDCYLRGIYYYTTQQFKKLQKEIDIIRKIEDKDFETKEILINLFYLNPQVSLEQWLELVEALREPERKFTLYQMFGNSITYLCGLRDLSGLFACSAKEEKRRAHLWKKVFGENEWRGYQLARIDYYLETERRESISEEDWDLMRDKEISKELWQVRLAKLYLICKMQRMHYDERYDERIQMLADSLLEENNLICTELALCISNFYAPWYGKKERLSKWLRYAAADSTVAIDEENYVILYWQAKGYMMINQFECAEKILKKLIPYLKEYHRSRFLTEVLFQYAIICQEKATKGQALKNAIESFLYSFNSRYVIFYAGYGKKGTELLESYVEWHKAGFPESWSHKKKYNYGNVLRMPQEEYLNVVLRRAKKVGKSEKQFAEEYGGERLTMAETVILQEVGHGLTNQEICEKLGVKMPTVKGHIYNLYKKLGVNSRGQAIVKGKEMGILE